MSIKGRQLVVVQAAEPLATGRRRKLTLEMAGGVQATMLGPG